MVFKIFTIFIFLFLPQILPAQYSIKGFIKQYENGVLISKVTIFADSSLTIGETGYPNQNMKVVKSDSLG